MIDGSAASEMGRTSEFWLGEQAPETEQRFGRLTYTPESLQNIQVWSSAHLDQEIGGMLVGHRLPDGSTEVAHALLAPLELGTTGGFDLFRGMDTMQQSLTELQTKNGAPLEFVGWWHSHPAEGGTYGSGSPSWPPIPGGGEANGKRSGDLGVTAALVDQGIRAPEMLIVGTQRNGQIDLATWRWDATPGQEAAVYQRGVRVRGQATNNNITYWSKPDNHSGVSPLRVKAEDIIDIDFFGPPDIEWLTDQQVYVSDRLRALDVDDTQGFMQDFYSHRLLKELEVSPEMAENLAARILRQMEVEPALKLVEFIPTRSERFNNWTKGVVGRFLGSPQQKSTFDALIATPQFQVQAQRLQELFGQEVQGFNTLPKLVAGCMFLKHLELATTEPAFEITIGANVSGAAANNDANVSHQALLDQIELEPIAPPAPIDFDPFDSGVGVSAAEQEAGGGNWPVKVRRMRELPATIADLQAKYDQIDFDAKFEADGLNLNRKISTLKAEEEALRQEFDSAFGAVPGGVFYDIFGDADGGAVDSEGIKHRRILEQRDSLVVLAKDYFAGIKHNDDLAQWHSQAAQALQGLRVAKISGEELVKRMVAMKQ